ncbi:MAG: cytochrome C biogenesis protein CcmF, partial [Burkholderiales bacterium]|nr:cytochrome C biogenesis protein CcmF [Burkholderiales bacterium]
MIPEIGHFLLIFAAIVSIVAAGGVFSGYYIRNQYITGLWKPALGLVMGALTLSLACLVYSFLTNDFSVAYVANHSNTELEPIYKTAAVWGSHEGSMLLWIWIIAGWASCLLLFTRGADEAMGRNQAVVLAILGIFCIFLLATSNPFTRILAYVPSQ